ncbi:GNAT family N-acetyltransferase [Cohnella pontilimi]|uniref:GNAT family N-acetyltransferase n=2 Tax=Cohnella pontilimi TaxID=2564100 RepID=A0A4U0FD24_9BACL|nr:GNAT family N-acetyltransferase [Cohnella pontilimi]
MDSHFEPEFLKWKLGNKEAIIAELEGRIIGYLRLEYIWSKIPYIGLIFILPDHRGKGIGKQLMEFVEEHLRNTGHSNLYSSSQVNEAEPQAWHRHIGFQEVGIIAGINEGGIGEVFFRKDL